MENSKILVIEDDINIRKVTRAMLEMKGYQVYTAETLETGQLLTEKYDPDLIVLDILLPDGNGLDYCRRLRNTGKGVRILFISALNTHADIINGLKAGGDDYLAKPYLTEELLLRIQALLKRGRILPEQEDTTGILNWQRMSRQVFADGRDLLLKPKEYAVLDYLCHEPGHYFPEEVIYRDIWNCEPLGDFGPLHNQIYSLRQNLSGTSVSIEYSRSQGYRVLLP